MFGIVNGMKPLYSASQTNTAISDMAHHIIALHGTSRPLFIALLRGAAPFTAKLMFEIARQAPDMHPELDYMTVKTYGAGRTPGEPQIIMDISPDTEVKGRTVIVLDDVLDQGVTSSFVAQIMKERGATTTLLAVLVEKDILRTNQPHADFACFHAGEEWLVGMGMDDTTVAKDGYRWLDEIRVVKS